MFVDEGAAAAEPVVVATEDIFAAVIGEGFFFLICFRERGVWFWGSRWFPFGCEVFV